MRRIILSLALLCLALSFTCCDAFRTISKVDVNSQGSPYELIVVCPQAEWEGELGDTLRSALLAPVPFLNQTEPHFDILRVTPQNFSTNNLVARHRNILQVLISEEVEQADVAVQYDKTASPQIVLTLQAPSQAAAVEFVSENRAELILALESAERKRDVDFANKFTVESLNKLIEDEFGVHMRIPQGYTLRSESDDFLWISYEYPEASQGLMLYSYPVKSVTESLSAEALTKARNEFARRVPGPTDGSYMTTYSEMTPGYRLFRLNGRLWVEMRGFWDVEGDFMGGPYVSYSTIDTRTNRVFTLDCYVFSPNLGKRNFVRGLEHILYSVEIPE